MPRAVPRQARNIRLAASLLTLALVAGCYGPADDPGPRAVAAAPAVESAPPPPVAMPRTKPGQTIAKVETAPVAPPAAATPENEAPAKAAATTDATPDADPEDLVGMDEPMVEATLGLPSTARDVPPAIIWHYLANDCVVSVYFYLNLESQVFQVLRYEIVPRTTATIDGATCYQSLNQARRMSRRQEG